MRNQDQRPSTPLQVSWAETGPSAEGGFGRSSSLGLAGALALGLCVTGCGGGGGGDGESGEPFQLTQLGSPSGVLTNGITWEINRPIEFVFSEPIDFTTVSANSINILTDQGSIPALGEYRLKTEADGTPIENVVVWQPRCPLEADLSDAGLTPGGELYRLLVLGQDIDSTLAVRSQSGKPLTTSQTRVFLTPSSLQAEDLFFDPVFGPPDVLVQTPISEGGTFSFLETLAEDELGGLSPVQTPFTLDTSGQAVLIPDVPINLFSAADQRLSVVLEFNQPVNPGGVNISAERLRLQFLDEASGQWLPVDTIVELEANCTVTGARVRLTPRSILPQESLLRVEVSSSFEDLIGTVNDLPLNGFSRLETIAAGNDAFDPPGNLGDEIFEPFLVGAPSPSSLEDPEPEFAEPIALWDDGKLSPNFNFLGTGGPGGNFDWVVTSPNASFNTTSQTVSGGPGGAPTLDVTFPNGVVNVRDFVVAENANLRVFGPNPLQIFATGEIRIEGRILAQGFDAPDVVQLNTPIIPKSGGPGAAGGGDGGLGTPSTTQSSASGGDGRGPFQQPGGGGRGGESAGTNTSQFQQQRPGGGGGGAFAVRHALPDGNNDSLLVTANFVSVYGPGIVPSSATAGQQNLQPIDGSDGVNQSIGVLTGSSPARGGLAGPARFINSNVNDDFWGVRLQGEDATILRGELSQPSAGSGGGGGGDIIKSSEFPQVPWNKPAYKNELSAGGGGGGGPQLQLLALGPIVFAGEGQINARGGAGGRGESISGGINNTAGSGGGGSGGHVILQSATAVDFSASTRGLLASGNPDASDFQRGILAINALGGDGGPGGTYNPTSSGDRFNQGGYVNQLVDPAAPNQSNGNKPNAGGAGGAGVVQIHVPNPEDNIIFEEDSSAQLEDVVQPVPYVLVPTFGPVSKARSIPIPLAGANDNPGSTLAQVLFEFRGTNDVTEIVDPEDPEEMIPNPDAGLVLRDGTMVEDLLAILSGSLVSVDTDLNAVVVDASSLLTSVGDPISDDIYLRNPALLRQFALDLTSGGTTTRFDVGSAQFDTDTDELQLALEPGAAVALSNFAAGTNFELVPRFFRIRTNDAVDALPESAAVRFRFQGLAADLEGNPNLEEPLVDWTADISEFNAVTLTETISFIRTEVEFDIAADDGGLSTLNARPVLDFMRTIFLF